MARGRKRKNIPFANNATVEEKPSTVVRTEEELKAFDEYVTECILGTEIKTDEIPNETEQDVGHITPMQSADQYAVKSESAASDVETELNSLKDENSSLRGEIEELNNVIRSKVSEIERLRNEMSVNIKDGEKTIAGLERLLENEKLRLSDKNSELMVRNSELMFDVTRLEVVNSKLENDISQLKKTIQDLEEKNSSVPVDTKKKSVYTMASQTPQRGPCKYISTNGYTSWN